MKKPFIPPLPIDSVLSKADESVLREGETLLIARGLRARSDARQSGHYIASDEILMRLDASLAKWAKQ